MCDICNGNRKLFVDNRWIDCICVTDKFNFQVIRKGHICSNGCVVVADCDGSCKKKSSDDPIIYNK